jgi:hypothetical protein
MLRCMSLQLEGKKGFLRGRRTSCKPRGACGGIDPKITLSGLFCCRSCLHDHQHEPGTTAHSLVARFDLQRVRGRASCDRLPRPVMASRLRPPLSLRSGGHRPREGTRAFSGPLIATAVRSSSSVEGRSCQFGRANAPMMPQLVHTIRGPNHGTGTSSGLGVDTEHRLMVAEVADDLQRAHALRPHVGERHWRAAVAIHGHAVNLPLDKTREQAR